MTQRDLRNLSPQNSARDGDTSGRQTNTEVAVPVTPNLHDLSEVHERADAGQVVELAMYRSLLAPALERNGEATPPPLDPEIAAGVASDIATARDELVKGAMKRLDVARGQDGAGDLHLKVGLLVLDLEEIMRELAAGYGS